ncbi:WcbI family polysaccharide biosynthesis putative acetyltransferase [Humitalea sp. 24SJ18S-53]|uniref:WcbI family polysaccharide biosynthesis putative acetyltransferase n=1 Tax=Humitalea sp. 24SJ18S-53 TaxID=3422307 RepID=UPI003D6741AF
MDLRIGVLGNCQAAGFATSFAVLAPQADRVVVRLDTNDKHGDLAGFADALASCDVLFTQPIENGPFGPLATEHLAPRARRAIILPAFVFRGFHPDRVVLVPEGSGAPIGPMGPYHSALAMAGFIEGVPVARLLRLFNGFTYAALGYFDTFAHDRAFASSWLAPKGYDFDEITADAPAEFMHSPNHPKLAVLFAIARSALLRAGIAPRDAPVPRDDFVECCRWPVYPELARRLGCPGGLDFSVYGRDFTLPAMLEASYVAYGRAGPAAWGGVAPPAVGRARAFLREHVLGRPPPPALTAEDVRIAYRFILGRDCESDAVAEWHAAQHDDMATLRRRLIASAEFGATRATMRARSG